MDTLLQSLQGWGLAGILIAFALCAWRPGYRWLRHLSTLVHEVGHAFVGMVTGAQLRGIALHADASGTTTTGHQVGTLRGGFSRFMTTLAGYPAPIAFATAVLMGFTLTENSYVWSWWTMLVMSALCIIFARSLFTFVVASMFAALPVTFLFLWTDATDSIQSAGLWFIVGTLVWGGIQGMLELNHISLREPQRDTDASAVKSMTGLPLLASTGLLWLLTGMMPVVMYLLAGWFSSLLQ